MCWEGRFCIAASLDVRWNLLVLDKLGAGVLQQCSRSRGIIYSVQQLCFSLRVDGDVPGLYAWGMETSVSKGAMASGEDVFHVVERLWGGIGGYLRILDEREKYVALIPSSRG